MARWTGKRGIEMRWIVECPPPDRREARFGESPLTKEQIMSLRHDPLTIGTSNVPEFGREGLAADAFNIGSSVAPGVCTPARTPSCVCIDRFLTVSGIPLPSDRPSSMPTYLRERPRTPTAFGIETHGQMCGPSRFRHSISTASVSMPSWLSRIRRAGFSCQTSLRPGTSIGWNRR